MAKRLGVRIRNYRALADVTLGKIEYNPEEDDLASLICLIGPNGSGKSTLLDALGFLADCLREGVEAACDKPHRGGFRHLRTQGDRSAEGEARARAQRAGSSGLPGAEQLSRSVFQP